MIYAFEQFELDMATVELRAAGKAIIGGIAYPANKYGRVIYAAA